MSILSDYEIWLKKNRETESFVFSKYDLLTMMFRDSEMVVFEEFLYHYYFSVQFLSFARNYGYDNVFQKIREEKLRTDMDDFDYECCNSTYPTVTDLSVYIRTLSVVQFAYVMLGYYIGLPRKFVKRYAKKEVNEEQMRLIFYMLKQENISITDIENVLLPDISMRTANSLLKEVSNRQPISYYEIPVYENIMFTAAETYGIESVCNSLYHSPLLKMMDAIYDIKTTINENEEFVTVPYETSYPPEEKLTYYMKNLNFSQFQFVMLGYYYGFSQGVIDDYAQKEYDYHFMEWLFLKRFRLF